MQLSRLFTPLVAALALVLSPGVAAPWLELAHHCASLEPAGPALPPAHSAHHQGSGHGPAPEHSSTPGSGTHQCLCVGACQATVLAAPAGAAAPPAWLAVATTRGFQPTLDVRVARRAHVHPPAQAPPSLLV